MTKAKVGQLKKNVRSCEHRQIQNSIITTPHCKIK